MGLRARVLLERYFSVEDIKNALYDIGETVSGNKSQLIRRLMANWEAHNRDLYGLLDFVDVQTLRIICMDYGLDHRGDRNTLSRRIRRADLLINAKKGRDGLETQPVLSESTPATVRVPSIRRLRFRWPLLVSGASTVVVYLLLPLSGLTETPIQFGAAIAFFFGLWSSLHYLSGRT